MSIQLKDISKSFDSNLVFDKLNIQFNENRVTCIMGPSGSGKTTLMNIMLGLLKPDSGKIEGIEGKRKAAVFQEDRLCDGLNAVKNVMLVCDKKVQQAHIEQEFYKVGLTDYANKPVAELSGGMKRRVAIIRALLPESDIIFMDEPFKGLDEKLKSQVIQYVKHKTIGKTVIIVTHDKEEAEVLSAERIYL